MPKLVFIRDKPLLPAEYNGSSSDYEDSNDNTNNGVEVDTTVSNGACMAKYFSVEVDIGVDFCTCSASYALPSDANEEELGNADDCDDEEPRTLYFTEAHPLQSRSSRCGERQCLKIQRANHSLSMSLSS